MPENRKENIILRILPKSGHFMKAVFIAAFMIRILFTFVMGDFDSPEMYEHGRIARNLLSGNGFTMHWPYPSFSEERELEHSVPPKYEGAFIPPLSPYYVYFFLKIFGDNSTAYFFLMLFNSLIGALTPLFAYLIARKISGETEARLSALAALIFLPAVFSVITFSGSAIYQTVALAVIYYMISAVKEGRMKYLVISGILSGILVLLRSEFLLLGTILLFVMLLYFRKKNNLKFSKLILPALFTFLSFTVIITPWIIRNTLLFDKYVPIVSHPWHEIWRGNNPYSSGGAIAYNGKKMWINKDMFPEIIEKLDAIPITGNFELQADSVFKEEVKAFWNENPSKVLFLGLKRMFFLWTVDIYTPRARDIKYIFFVIITVIPFAYGLSILYRRSKKEGSRGPVNLIILFLLYYTLLVGVVNLETRYQVYLLTMCLPLCGISWKYFFDKISRRPMHQDT